MALRVAVLQNTDSWALAELELSFAWFIPQHLRKGHEFETCYWKSYSLGFADPETIELPSFSALPLSTPRCSCSGLSLYAT